MDGWKKRFPSQSGWLDLLAGPTGKGKWCWGVNYTLLQLLLVLSTSGVSDSITAAFHRIVVIVVFCLHFQRHELTIVKTLLSSSLGGSSVHYLKRKDADPVWRSKVYEIHETFCSVIIVLVRCMFT